MNQPQPTDMNDFLAFAAQQAGLPPEQAAAQPQQPPAQQPQQPQPETTEGKAQAAMAPSTEGTRQAENPIIEYELPGKDGQPGRKLTATQIEGVMSRYRDLNYKHAQLAPVMQLAEQWMAQNPGATSQDLVDAVIAMSQAAQPNPEMGKGAQNRIAAEMGAQPKPSNQPLSIDALRQWEEQNATSLPPGYAEMMQQMQQFGPMMAQQQSMLSQLLGQASGVADASRQAVQSAQSQAVSAQKSAIANNLDRAQQSLQLPDNLANDFMMFAGERGYMLEDFIDPRLTISVMRDFRNQVLSGDMERIRSVHQKRMAYTGLAAQSPSNGAQPKSQSDQDLNSFVDSIMARRPG